jgi:exosortase E/protease (VPEID-CTERM system)
MSMDLAYSRTEQATIALPWARLVGVALVLVGEVLALTIRFDTNALNDENGVWVQLLGEAHHLPHLALAVAAALLPFAGRQLYEELRECIGERCQPAQTWPYAVGHLATFAVFYQLTDLLLEGNLQESHYGNLWAAAWLYLGLTSTAFLGLIALPASLWYRLGRRAALPVCIGVIVGVAAWGAGQVTDQLWLLLSHSTFWIVQQLLGLFVPHVICSPAEFLVGTPTFVVQVSPGCSGYEGLGLVWVFLGGYLWLFRRTLRFPHAWLLLPLGTVLIYLANAVRITALVALGTWASPAVALGGFHSQAGWLAFNGVALGLVVLAQRLRFFTRAEAEAPPVRGVNPSAAYLAPLLALVASVMITTALSDGFDYLYPLRVVAVGAVFWFFRREYARLRWGWSWTAVALGAAVFILWLMLEPLAGKADTAAGLPEGLAHGWVIAWLVFRFVGSVVTVPLAEELAFRGFLTRRLQASQFEEVPLGRFTWLSFLVSSLLFGLLHGRWLAGTLAGMLYAVALYRRGKLADPVLAHATTNALIAVYVLTTGTWSLWS